MAQILIIDDDRMLCDMVKRKLNTLEHTTESAHTLKDGIAAARAREYDLILLDVRLPDGSGIEEITTFTALPSHPELIIITGEGSADGARIAIETGAWDYIEKPLSMREIVLQLNQALLYRKEKNRNQQVTLLNRENIIGNDPALNHCLQQLALMAPADSPMLITGETGTGKELFARAIHTNSSRSTKPFVVLDCAAFPENLVESMLFGHVKGAFTGAEKSRDGLILEADGGTLFMDEVGELPMNIQKTFLRVLQERTFRPVGSNQEMQSNFRLVAATNRDLEEMVEAGNFRSDLLYRLKAATLHLPPLRERQSDIESLTLSQITRLCNHYGTGIKGVSQEFLELLRNYPWPGNVRELYHAVESAVSIARMHDTLFPKHLPASIRIGSRKESSEKKVAQTSAVEPVPAEAPHLADLKSTLEETELNYLRRLLEKTGGDVQQSCSISGLSRSGLYSRLKKYGINRPS